MNNRWTFKQISEIASVTAGQGAPQGESNYCLSGGKPFIKAGNLEELLKGKSEFSIQQVSDDVVKKYNLKLYPAGSIVFAKSGMSSMKGLVYALKNDCYVVSHLAIITPKEMVSSEYLTHALRFFKPNSLIKDAAYPTIALKDITRMELPIPPLDTQTKIVNYLDSAFAKIDTMKQNAKNSLEQAQALFKSALNEYLTPKEDWVEKRMDEMCSIEANLVDPTLEENQDLLHVGGANIISYTGQLVKLRTARDEKLTSGKFKFDNSVILYNKIRPYLVKVALPNFSGLCSADMYPLNPKANILKDFLYYILISSDFTVYAIKGSARAGMPKVNRKWLFAYKCHIPHYEEQVYIANRLNAIKAKIELLTKNNASIYEECDALKQAILKQIFG
jgi:type I restriction enzyme, S subunit